MARIGSARPERICLICSACCVARRQRTSSEARACSSSWTRRCSRTTVSRTRWARSNQGLPGGSGGSSGVVGVGKRGLRVELAQGLEVPLGHAVIAAGGCAAAAGPIRRQAPGRPATRHGASATGRRWHGHPPSQAAESPPKASARRSASRLSIFESFMATSRRTCRVQACTRRASSPANCPTCLPGNQ